MTEKSDSSRCSSIFQERDDALAQLGFASYSDYLASDLWQWVRGLLKDKRECQACKCTTGLAWHHRDYSIPILVGNFCDDSIVRLCNKCHNAIHQEDGHWFDMEEVDRRFIQLTKDFNRCDGDRLKACRTAFYMPQTDDWFAEV